MEKVSAGSAPTETPRLISVPEFSQRVGIKKEFGWQLVWTGQIAHVRVGRRVFIDTADIEPFIRQRKARAS